MDTIRRGVRAVVRKIAKGLNTATGGHVTPAMITYTGLTAHVGIAWLIATGYNLWAAVLLVIFGLFDVLDGELARLQGSASQAGMLLDSITDRVKEILLYIGVGYAIVYGPRPHMAVWAVAALGASILVSYVNAWGEAVTAGNTKSHQVNKAFRSGIMGYELRMAVLLVGLISDRLILASIVVATLAAITAIQRFANISQSLKHVQS